MADSKEATQRPNEEAPTPDVTDQTSTTLDQARRFLDDENVRSSSREKKAEFLKSKGISDEDCEKLLSEATKVEEEQSAQKDEVPSAAVETPESFREITPKTEPPTETLTAASSSPASEPPPIITYPEFLTHSPKPPPLLTPSRLLTTATVLSTAWTLAYGAARFIVSPMVETLSESRADYYEHVNSKLGVLVEKLEGVVSEVPYKNGKPLKSEVDIDDDSSYGDPTEMFHRDIGTQTSPPTSEASIPSANDKAVDEQALRLGRLTTSLKELSDMYTAQAENSGNLYDTMHGIREDVDKLAYPNMPEYSSMYGGSGFGVGRTADPDDEIKKTKDAIRSVKGMFLSSRMFPAAAAR